MRHIAYVPQGGPASLRAAQMMTRRRPMAFGG